MRGRLDPYRVAGLGGGAVLAAAAWWLLVAWILSERQ